MVKNFRTFDLSVAFYRIVEMLQIPSHLQNQLSRAASSIALNLAEGRGKKSKRDQVRFFSIALGSLRECQAVLILTKLEGTEAWKVSDKLGASLFLLIKNARG